MQSFKNSKKDFNTLLNQFSCADTTVMKLQRQHVIAENLGTDFMNYKLEINRCDETNNDNITCASDTEI